MPVQPVDAAHKSVIAMAQHGASQTSSWCEAGDHNECPHKYGSGLHFFRRGPKREVAILCSCGCHSSCAIAGSGEVPKEQWANACTCPGSSAMRETEARVQRDIDARQARLDEVFRDVEIGRGKSPEEIQREILAAYETHGY